MVRMLPCTLGFGTQGYHSKPLIINICGISVFINAFHPLIVKNYK